MDARTVLTLRPEGLYCPEGDFYIDPHRPVDRAVITHGHADHARPGNSHVLTTPETARIMAIRMTAGTTGTIQEIRYGEPVTINGVTVTLLPAGHILGSAQVLVETHGRRVIVSGDYKRRRDPTCAPFELAECDLFVTEATFGLPVFRHPPDRGEINKLLRSLDAFPDRPHLLGAYSLGKAQRVLMLMREAGYDRPVFLHGAMTALCDLYAAFGLALGPLRLVTDVPDKADLKGAVVLCPPSSLSDRWSRGFGDAVRAFASGWMMVRQRAKQRGVELPLVLSDHADWTELTTTIEETRAGVIWVTHGREEALVHFARSIGREAEALSVAGREEEGS